MTVGELVQLLNTVDPETVVRAYVNDGYDSASGLVTEVVQFHRCLMIESVPDHQEDHR